ncbi:MAG: hypothetical protein WBM90_03625 [Acidimicrobiia bacterium]
MDEEQSSILQEIYSGAEDAGLQIVGISEIEIEPNESAPGDRFTLTVRVGESGRLLPRRGDTEDTATSLLRLEVYQHTLEDSSGDMHHVWKSYARQVDIGKGRLFETAASGPTAEQIDEYRAGRPAHEYLDDPEFIDETLARSASTPSEAVRQALLPLSDGSGGLQRGTESETDVWDPEPVGTFGLVVPSDSYMEDSEGHPVSNVNDSADDEGDVPTLAVTEDSSLSGSIEAPDSELGPEDHEGIRDAGSPNEISDAGVEAETADSAGVPAWVKWGTPAVVAALLIGGLALFGGGPDDTATATSLSGSTGQVAESNASDEEQPQQQSDGSAAEETQEDQTAEEPAAEPDTPQVDLVEIGRFALIGGEASSYTAAGGFDAFFHLLFVPNDVIATISKLDDAEDYAEKAKQTLTTDRDLAVVGEVEVTQYQGDPASNPPNQSSVGAVIRINPTLFDVATIGTDGSSYTEVNVFRLFFCESYPDCEGSHVVGVNLGGPLDLDAGQAILDALLILEQGPSGVADGYGWGFQITGDISEVSD